MSSSETRRKPWSVLAYTVADDARSGSPLDQAAQQELKGICDAADLDQVSVAAQIDFKRVPGVFRAALTMPSVAPYVFEPIKATSDPLWKQILGSLDENSKLVVKKNSDELNAARRPVLQKFLAYGQSNCPANRYLVVFYGHSCGPMGLFFDADPQLRRATVLRLNDLAASLARVKPKAAIILFRDCYMNTLETAYQLSTLGEYMIATQAEVPADGVWPWDCFLGMLLPSADSGDIAITFGKRLAKFYTDSVNRQGYSRVPYSVVDLNAVREIAKPLRALVRGLERARSESRLLSRCSTALEQARVGSPRSHRNPGDPALLDVLTMCDNLQIISHKDIARPAKTLGEVVRTRLVKYRHPRDGPHRGIGLYYRPTTKEDRARSYIEPESERESAEDSEYYAQLALSKETGWDHIALQPLIAKTQSTLRKHGS